MLLLFILTWGHFFTALEREEGREREKTSICCLPHMPHPGIEPTTFSVQDDTPTNWATQPRCSLFFPSSMCLFSTYKWYHMVLVFLWLTLVTIMCSSPIRLPQMEGKALFSGLNLPHLLKNPSIHWWAFGLFPYHSYCEQCCEKRGSVCVSSNSHFMSFEYTLTSGIAGLYESFIFNFLRDLPRCFLWWLPICIPTNNG